MNDLLRRSLFTTYQDEAGGDGDAGGAAGAGEGDAGGEGAGDTNWRTPFGAEAQATLERYKTEEEAGKAFMELRQYRKDNAGVKPLADDASDEDRTAWREANGLPKESSEYLDSLPEGTEIGDDEKLIYDGLADVLLGHNAPKELFGGVYDWAVKLEQEIAEAETADDEKDSGALQEELREDWGNADYRSNLNLIDALIKTNLPEDQANVLLNARSPEGGRLFNNRAIVEMFVSLGRQQNPAAAVLENYGGEPINDLEKELDAIRSDMRTDRPAYDKDAKKQQRYRDLLDAQEKQKAATRK